MIMTYEFLVEKLGEQLDINRTTNEPCLDYDINLVWQAINQLGGVEVVAHKFGLPVQVVAGWIDDHYIPNLYAHDVAWPCDFSVSDVQVPELSYQDVHTRTCWPLALEPKRAEKQFEKVIKKRDRRQAQCEGRAGT